MPRVQTKPKRDISELRTWIDIDRRAIAKNYRVIRKLIGKRTKLLGVVKSNAYGHGLSEFAHELARLGVDMLGVDSLVEALRLRRDGVKVPILVLGYTLPTLYQEAIKQEVTLTLSSFEMLDEIRKLKIPKQTKGKLCLHVKIDTGMHRQGFQETDAQRLFDELASSALRARVMLSGVYTHFADAKTVNKRDFTESQIKSFDQWRTRFINEGYQDLTFHAGATAGLMIYDRAHYDMVRAGIALYGVFPSDSIANELGKNITLEPVLSWKSVVGEVKRVKKGETVGYDRSELLVRDTTLAVIPVGYWHGFRRSLSGKGRVLIRGKSARVLGRVSMDMIVVDVTDISGVRVGDEVVLIGRQKGEAISLNEIAQFAGVSPYEFVTTLNPLIYRQFTP